MNDKILKKEKNRNRLEKEDQKMAQKDGFFLHN